MLVKSLLASAIRFVLLVIALPASQLAHLLAAAPISPWLYRAYQTEDGLPDISITGVTQTEDGYLWVATKGGLLCFNGEKFAAVPQANLPALPSRTVRAMFRDRHDQLWLGMERGPIFCFKPDGLASFSAEDGLSRQRVLTITEDREDAVWVVSPTQLRRIRNQQVEAVDLPSGWTEQVDLQAISDSQGNIWCVKGGRLALWRDGKWVLAFKFNQWITALCAGSKSNLWISAGGRMFDFKEGNDPVEIAQLPPNTVPRFLLEDRAGALWIGTAAEGLFRLGNQQLEKVPTSHLEISCLYEDREGNIWVGTEGGGLNLIRPRTAGLVGRGSGLPFESVQSVTEDTDGWLWAVAQDGQLARAKDNHWELVSGTTSWTGGNATCVAADARTGVWVGTSNRGLKYFRDGVWRGWQQRDGLVSDAIRSLLVTSNGDVWAAAAAPNRLQRLRDGKILAITNSIPLGAIRALAEGADGVVWLGTAEGQIQYVHGATLRTASAITEPTPLSVRSLLATSDGRLWIGYAGDGLGHFKDGKYQRLTASTGLADDFISQLLADERGNLWITGNRGLSRVSVTELDAVMRGELPRISARIYGNVDGLPGMQPNRNYSPSAWRGRDGRLWFSMHSGLLSVNPEKVRDNPHHPPVQLERVRVDDQLVALYNADSPLQTQLATNCVNLRNSAEPLRLGPSHRKIEIDFAALSFASPENVQFRCRLTGFDDDWVEVGPSRRASYPRLRGGTYEFRVIARNNSGVWNEAGAGLVLAVSPFFYETWWFRICGGLATVILAAGTALVVSRHRYRQKLRRLEARRALEQERARIARDIHDDLGATLTRISLLSQPARSAAEDAEEAETTATTLARIHQTARDLTHAMGEVVWAVNPEHDTFDSLANYISSYAQNFLRAAGIRCRIEVPLQLPKQPLSAEVRHNLFLAFKEALNNVVKHAQASEVRIILAPQESGFELRVADNGIGFTRESVAAQTRGDNPARPAPGNGLANMLSRLEELGGACDLQSEPGTGTRVTFRVRLKATHGQP